MTSAIRAPDETHRTRTDTTDARKSVMDAIIQVVGSLLILVPFVLVQVGRLKTTQFAFLLLNAVGSTVLAVDAALGEQWGFLLLEGVWAIVSVASIVRSLLGKPTGASVH